MPKRSLLLLVLVLACDEARGRIVQIRPVVAPAQTGGETAGAPADIPDAEPMVTAGMGGQPTIDSGTGEPPMGGAGAGSAGSPPILPTCEPLPPKPWVAIGAPSSLSTTNMGLYNPPLQAVDDMLDKRWSTGREQAGGEWIEIDFGHPVTLTLLELDHKANRSDDDATNADFPAQLLVSMSERSRDFGAPILADVAGTQDFTMVTLSPPATGRYLLLQQTGTKSDWWSIHEVKAVCDIPVPSP